MKKETPLLKCPNCGENIMVEWFISTLIPVGKIRWCAWCGRLELYKGGSLVTHSKHYSMSGFYEAYNEYITESKQREENLNIRITKLTQEVHKLEGKLVLSEPTYEGGKSIERSKSNGKRQVVINRQYGGFGISDKAIIECIKRGSKTQIGHTPKQWFGDDYKSDLEKTKKLMKQIEPGFYEVYDQFESSGNVHRQDGVIFYKNRFYSSRDIDRDDPILIEVVKELGERANGQHATLKIIEIPNGVEYKIEEYDGNEWISEQHKTWG